MDDGEDPVSALLARAVGRYRAGEVGLAADLFRQAVALDPDNAVARHQLGLIAFAQGDPGGAVGHLQRAAEAAPANAEYRNNLGVVLHAVGEPISARTAFARALALEPGFAQAANNLGSVLEKLGEAPAAIASYHRALAADPGFVEARDNLVLACAKAAPPWHFPMMSDQRRNAAYAAALARVAPGRRVLDIGAGSGLLAMMAARAGAAIVTTCEMEPTVAARAAAVIAANGLADQVILRAKRSTEIEVGKDLDLRAEVLVSEIFASGVLSEEILPTLEDARERLLTPDATVIPRRAAAHGYLVGGPAIEAQLFAPTWSGFDLSAFDELAPVKLGLHLDRLPHQAMSDDFEIFAFDLTQPRFAPERRALGVRATASGRCAGVAQWLRLDLDDQVTYDNRPHVEAGPNGWMHVLYRFAEVVEVEAGETIDLVASHNRTAMTVALARTI